MSPTSRNWTAPARAVVLASGAPAALVRTLPWYTGPHKEALRLEVASPGLAGRVGTGRSALWL
jgi:hypothetical protein